MYFYFPLIYKKLLEKAKKKFPEITSVSIERPKTMKVNGIDCVVYQITGEDNER